MDIPLFSREPAWSKTPGFDKIALDAFVSGLYSMAIEIFTGTGEAKEPKGGCWDKKEEERKRGTRSGSL
jgi:hypothetical protein